MRKLRLVLALAGVLVVSAAFAAAATADDDDDGDGDGSQPGFVTGQDPMLIGLNGTEVQKIITVGDDLPNGFQFEAIPDGISVFARGGDDDGDDLRRSVSDDDDEGRTFDLFINHETSTVAFAYPANPVTTPPTHLNSQNDFDNSQVSRLTLNRDAEVVDGEFAIDKTAGFHRFCSNYIASGREGFSRPILFTNEEATDWVDRDGMWLTTNPANAPGTEQLGLVVAYDIRNETFKPIFGMGRHNHENSVALRGYGHPVVLSGDDTFSAPASQLYLYTARNVNNLLADGYSPPTQLTYSRSNQRLWAFKANDSADADSIIENDYGDLDAATGETVSGQFIPVPENIAKGDQTGLENWSNQENVFQFIRVEDIAVDRNDRNVFYFADTGEPRATQHPIDPATNRLSRGVSGTQGPFPNGRIFKMVLDRRDPTKVLELSIVANADAGGYFQAANPTPWQQAMHNPDNLESTRNSLIIQEDPGGHNNVAGQTAARIWKLDLDSPVAPGTNPIVVAVVDQSDDGGPTDVPAVDGQTAASPNGLPGSWESSGIVDASSVLGRGWFFTTIQAHTLWIQTAPGPNHLAPAGPDWTYKREGGQLLAIKIPDA